MSASNQKSDKGSLDQDDILPRDSVSQVGQSNVSTSSHELRAAAAKSAAIQARLESLQQIQDLEREELALKAKQEQREQELKARQRHEMFALKQKTDQLKMAAELKIAQAEEEALSEHGSVVSKGSSVHVLSKSDKPKGNSASVEPKWPDGSDKLKGHNGSDKLESYKLNQEAPVLSYVTSDNTALIKLIQQSQQQQQQLLNSILLPKAELSTFDGNPLQYWTFMNAFKNNVGCTTASDSAKLTRLLQYCHGKARKAIECCQVLDPKQGYNKALEMLSDRFGNSYVIAETWISKIMDGPNLMANDKEGIQSYSDELRNCVECLKAMGHLEEINTQRVMATLIKRLPRHLHARWLREVQDLRVKSKKPHIEHLTQFVESFASEVNDPVFGHLFDDNKRGKEALTGLYSPKNKGNGKRSTFNIQTGKPEGSNDKLKPCIVCNGRHSLFGCDQFKGFNVEKRREIASDNRLCYNCLLPNHMSQSCTVKRTCTVNGCGKRHTKFLHLNVSYVSSPNETQNVDHENDSSSDETTVSGTNTHASRANAMRVALPIVPVMVKVEGNTKFVRTMALLDGGSTTTFCSEALHKQLGLGGRKETMSLTTLTNGNAKFGTSVVDMEVSPLNGKTQLHLREVCTVSSLPIRQENIATRDDIKDFNHLHDIDFQFPEVDSVGLLIGQDHGDILKPRDMRLGDEGSPFAVKTLLGWTLNGPIDNGKGSKQRTGSSYLIHAELDIACQVDTLWSTETSKLSGEETFVTDKVSAIPKSSDVTERHVVDNLNPTDKSSGEPSAAELSPSLPGDPEGIWPNEDTGFDDFIGKEPEFKRQVHEAIYAGKVNTPTETCVSYPSWYRRKRPLAILDQFSHFRAKWCPVRTIHNDTNFVDVERELREALEKMDPDKIHSTLPNYNPDWKVNPPDASHQFPVRERQMCTVRNVLAHMLLEHVQPQDNNSNQCLLCEVEAIVDMGPLTTVSSDPGDLNSSPLSQILTIGDENMHPPLDVVQVLTSLIDKPLNAYTCNHKMDNIVLLQDDTLQRSKWLLGRVNSLEPDKTGFVRSTKIKTKDLTLRRPDKKMVLLVPRD